MSKGRMEAFSDAVIAIVLTIMVLGFKVPTSTEFSALLPLAPAFFSYALSFAFIGIYWSNHHHLLQAINHVNGQVLLANLHLLFWLTLIPFVTSYMGENHLDTLPVALYGLIMLLSGSAYFILTRTLLKLHGTGSTLAAALGRDVKGKLSLGIYVLAIPVALLFPWGAIALYVLVALMWLVPDRRIEKTLN